MLKLLEGMALLRSESVEYDQKSPHKRLVSRQIDFTKGEGGIGQRFVQKWAI